MKKVSIAGLQKCCEDELWSITDLKGNITPAKKKTIIKELTDSVATVYHEHSHADPCKVLLVDFAFASRICFFRIEGFIKLLEEEPEFGQDFYTKLLRSRDFQIFGRLQSTNSFCPVEKKCKTCWRTWEHTSQALHIFDDKKRNSNFDSLIRWQCGVCIKLPRLTT